MKIYAIIPSGGSGSRINSPLPKQYLKFNGKELIVYTLEIFQNCPAIDGIVIPAQREFFGMLESIREKFKITKLSGIVEGGRERQFSVFNAVKSLKADIEDIIVVHDAVRPLLPKEILAGVIETAKETGASVVAIKAKDTLIKGNDKVEGFVERNEIYYAQTPQAFSYGIFNAAMKKAVEDNFVGTDESMLVKRAGFEIKIVEGSSLNFKVTTTDDILMFDSILRQKGIP